jgi:hypothetical protein
MGDGGSTLKFIIGQRLGETQRLVIGKENKKGWIITESMVAQRCTGRGKA